MLNEKAFLIRFEGTNHAEANQYAEELRRVLLESFPNLTVQRRRDNSRAQDFGSTLVVILGTPAVTAVATAIGNWLMRRTSVSLTIETSEKKFVVQNINRKDVKDLAKLWLEHLQKDEK